MNEGDKTEAKPIDPAASVAALEQISAERKTRVESVLGGPVLRPAVPPRPLGAQTAVRPTPPARRERGVAAVQTTRAHNSLIDAPTEAVRQVEADVMKVRQLFHAISTAIIAAEAAGPALLARLSEPSAADLALSRNEFDVEAAKAFLEGASALLDSVKPKA